MTAPKKDGNGRFNNSYLISYQIYRLNPLFFDDESFCLLFLIGGLNEISS